MREGRFAEFSRMLLHNESPMYASGAEAAKAQMAQGRDEMDYWVMEQDFDPEFKRGYYSSWMIFEQARNMGVLNGNR